MGIGGGYGVVFWERIGDLCRCCVELWELERGLIEEARVWREGRGLVGYAGERIGEGKAGGTGEACNGRFVRS